MRGTLKAEFRKLFSVRSTYIIAGITLAITALINFWVMGIKNAEHANQQTTALLNGLMATTNAVGLFISIIAILLVGHEYRYNTIMYSLSAVNRRWKLLLAKYVVLTGYTLAFAALCLLAGAGLFYLGASVAGTTVIPQTIPVWAFIWHTTAYVLGSMTFAFIIVVLLRSLIGAIVFVLVVPSTIEGILGMLLKENSKYLPYSAIGTLSNFSPGTNYLAVLLTVVAYAVVGGAVAVWLFQKRDAN